MVVYSTEKITRGLIGALNSPRGIVILEFDGVDMQLVYTMSYTRLRCMVGKQDLQRVIIPGLYLVSHLILQRY